MQESRGLVSPKSPSPGQAYAWPASRRPGERRDASSSKMFPTFFSGFFSWLPLGDRISEDLAEAASEGTVRPAGLEAAANGTNYPAGLEAAAQVRGRPFRRGETLPPGGLKAFPEAQFHRLRRAGTVPSAGLEVVPQVRFRCCLRAGTGHRVGSGPPEPAEVSVADHRR